MQWYYAQNGESVGPLEDAEFQAAAEDGTITSDTLVWHEGMSDWVAYGQLVPSEGDAVPAEPAEQLATNEAPCTSCSRVFPMDEMIAYEDAFVCADCKGEFFQRVKEGAALPGIYKYGGFWIRFAAKFIDGIVVGAINIVVSMLTSFVGIAAATTGSEAAAIVVQLVLMAVQMGVALAYTAFFLGKFGATPGKMACKLKVIRSDGSPITYGRAVGRYFGEMLSQLTLNIGYLMAAFDEEKRTLHDRVCDTRVISTE